MKLVTFEDKKKTEKIGVVRGENVIDLLSAAKAHKVTPEFFINMLAFIENMPRSQEKAETLIKKVESTGPKSAVIKLKDVKLKAPVPRPLSIRDFMTFAEHLANSMNTIAGWKFPPAKKIDNTIKKIFGKGILRPSKLWYEIPAYYKGNTLSVIGHSTDVIWPSYEEKLDYELEFGIYISKKGKDISAKNAKNYIAGYTIFNDMSARKTQVQEISLHLGPAKGKDFDTGNIMGPYLVTPDEIGNPYNLQMSARVNGETWSAGNSKEMHYSFEELIEYVSRSETLYPGEFFGSGTVPKGCGLELDKWLQPGDVIELEVENIGILKNKIIK